MHVMFRRREGTGAMYADNRRRAPRSVLRRGPRRSAMSRGPNSERPWMKETDDAEALETVDLPQLIEAVGAGTHVLLDLLQDVGGYVHKCKRWRQRMPAEVVTDMADLLDWYVVLYTVGLIDSRGVWLGPKPGMRK